MAVLDDLDVEPIIGLEVHAQLDTRTKLFCDCPIEFAAEPNTRVCPVCLGLPGALPAINRLALEHALRACLALGCRVAERTRWDRKSYCYPDLPKNYQITQYDQPLARDGRFEFAHDGGFRRVRVNRVHLEEDAGKSRHEIPGLTAVDLNRAGTPLLEIVTEPDLRSAEQVREFAVQLRRLLRYLEVSTADMAEGQLRFEPNINVRIVKGCREYRTPIVEVKNLNSLRALHAAVEHEIARQVAAWREEGIVSAPGNKISRGWSEERGVTVVQREKEEADDYRYFPDPDLMPLAIQPAWVAALREDMPELPIARAARLMSEYRVSARQAARLADDRRTANLLDEAAEAGGDRATLAKHFLSFWARHANQRGTTIASLGISPDRLAELANLAAGSRINATAAGRLAEAMVAGPERPTILAERLDLMQVSDRGRITAWVREALEDNEQALRAALGGSRKTSAAQGYLAGQVMQISRGRADPRIVREIIGEKLREYRAQ